MSAASPFLRAVTARHDLSEQAMEEAVGAIVDGAWTPAQSGAFLGALAAKGESVDEIVGAARAMRARAVPVAHGLSLVVDTCGTGGDGASTINVSTGAAFVVAACGLPVAKHGNRAASSKCGSADVLEALGIAIDADPQGAGRSLERDRFAFLFAQRYHPAMRAIAPVRRELGVRTIFNLLGPLSNPAGATHQVVGVARADQVSLMGEALERLGAAAGSVIHARNGMDEIAGNVPTDCYTFGNGTARRETIEPADFGIDAPDAALAGGDPAQNAQALRSILAGERSPRADVVALNAALALLVAELAGSLSDALEQARNALHSGAAHAVYETVKQNHGSTTVA
jgi:anthranilate phosphoribosyltransferase